MEKNSHNCETACGRKEHSPVLNKSLGNGAETLEKHRGPLIGKRMLTILAACGEFSSFKILVFWR